MTTEERKDLDEAIQEFYDNEFHPNMKSEISNKAKTIALRCMILFWKENDKTKTGTHKDYKSANTNDVEKALKDYDSKHSELIDKLANE